MGQDGYWATKTYHCGRVGEKVKFFVPSSRGRRQGKSSPGKMAGNANNAARKLGRCLNENFQPGDGWLSLNYWDGKRYQRVLDRAGAMDPELPLEDRIWFAAQHEAELLMDRARRALRREGIALRYVIITADRDGATGAPVRVHHHVVCPAECVAAIKEKWGLPPERCGQERGERLWNQEDYTPLAEYMMKQVRHIPNAKKYTPSRNLMRAEPTPRRVVSGARLRPPKGCSLLYADPYTGERECQYIRYLLPPERWTGVWKGRGDLSDPATRAGTGARMREARAREGGGGGA